MRKIWIMFLAMLIADMPLSAASVQKTNSFSLEFTKNGVYEFAFYKTKDSEDEVHYLVFSPDSKDLLGSYSASFGLRWNIQSPLDYVLALEFSSVTTGSTGYDFMMRRVDDSERGLNFAVRQDGGYSIVLAEENITALLSHEDRRVIIKTGVANEVNRQGGVDISLMLNPPAGGYTSGQYVGYVRMVLTVG